MSSEIYFNIVDDLASANSPLDVYTIMLDHTIFLTSSSLGGVVTLDKINNNMKLELYRGTRNSINQNKFEIESNVFF